MYAWDPGAHFGVGGHNIWLHAVIGIVLTMVGFGLVRDTARA